MPDKTAYQHPVSAKPRVSPRKNANKFALIRLWPVVQWQRAWPAKVLTTLLGAVTLASFANASSAAELIMFEEHGCEWCEKWNEEIGVVYDRTSEGQRAPLRRVDIHDSRPVDLRPIKRINFTPTFVIVENGKEYGRILGYPGEDFFWPMLQKILAKLPSRDPVDAQSERPFAQPQPIRFEQEGAVKTKQKSLEVTPNVNQEAQSNRKADVTPNWHR